MQLILDAICFGFGGAVGVAALALVLYAIGIPPEHKIVQLMRERNELEKTKLQLLGQLLKKRKA